MKTKDRKEFMNCLRSASEQLDAAVDNVLEAGRLKGEKSPEAYARGIVLSAVDDRLKIRASQR